MFVKYLTNECSSQDVQIALHELGFTNLREVTADRLSQACLNLEFGYVEGCALAGNVDGLESNRLTVNKPSESETAKAHSCSSG